MKKFIKYVSVFVLVIFSFYYTNIVSKIFINKSVLMQKIIDTKSSVEIPYINAEVYNNYVIPGINGIVVDELNSYYQMKKEESFNESLFVLKEQTPDNSYYNHLDLIINKGNPYKNSVSIIINNNDNIMNYLVNNKLVFNRLVDIKSINKNTLYKQINNDFLHYEEVDKILDNNKGNTNICIINDNNIEFCKSYGKYLVKPNIYLYNNNTQILDDITSGDIIYIAENYKLSFFKLLLKHLEFNNIKLSYLDYQISESR